jgi:hypothetical protein
VDERLCVSVECSCAFDNVTYALHNNAAQAVRHEDDWPLARLPRLSFCLVSSLSTLYLRDLPLQAQVRRQCFREQLSTTTGSIMPTPQLSDNSNLDQTDNTEEETEEADDGGEIESGLELGTLDMDLSEADIAIIFSLIPLLLAIQQDVRAIRAWWNRYWQLTRDPLLASLPAVYVFSQCPFKP